MSSTFTSKKRKKRLPIRSNEIYKKNIFDSHDLSVKRRCLSIVRSEDCDPQRDIHHELPVERLTIGEFCWIYTYDHHQKRNSANQKNKQNKTTRV